MPDNSDSSFTYSDDEFMRVFNHILTNEKIAEPVVDIDAWLPSAEYDSLELVMIFGWLGEMFNINFDLVDVDTLLNTWVSIAPSYIMQYISFSLTILVTKCLHISAKLNLSLICLPMNTPITIDPFKSIL